MYVFVPQVAVDYRAFESHFWVAELIRFQFKVRRKNGYTS